MFKGKDLRAKLVLIGMVFGILLVIVGLSIHSPQLSLAQDGPDSTEEPGEDGGSDDGDMDSDEMDDELVARGEHLVRVVAACQDCHIAEEDFGLLFEDPTAGNLSGGFVFEFEPWGMVTAPNLTMLGEWTDEQIEQAIRYGMRPDGSPLLPPMPYPAYAGMSNEDMEAIIAYLRSLEPAESEIGEAMINDGMSREDVRTVPEIDSEAEFPAPDMADETEYGTYLATHVAACIRCHGGVDEDGVLDPEVPATADILLYADFGAFNAPSLAQSEVGELTDEELRTRIHEGLNEDGQPLFLMPTYAFTHLSDEEVDALIAWVRSQP